MWELLGLAILGLAIVFGILLILRSIKYFLVNAVMGLAIIFLANLFGLGISYSLLTILICAIGGIFGAVIVIVLSLLGVTI
ncbi:MAG: pro-sigmaK processing inhibitor BofA family protein [Methanotrichaceae archaeon]|nr:pro-sigmaK processing inhibitor BofA family protein [Methanotrichaceae archaeon]